MPDLHQCRDGHVWGTIVEMREVLRANERETRREVLENLKGCGRCTEKVRRLGGGL